MTNQMDQEVEVARRKVWWQRHPREEYGSCSDCAEEIDALIKAVRRQERERMGFCSECGGSGMGLERIGFAYEAFDQSDYTVAPCASCSGTGRARSSEEAGE